MQICCQNKHRLALWNRSRIQTPDGRSAALESSTTIASMSTAAPTDYSVAFVTTPDSGVATSLARRLVEAKLVACVNIIPGLTSIYAWEGKVNEDPEVLMMLKTRTERIGEVTRFVRENHPYSVAEVIALPIADGNASYLEWIGKTVPGTPAGK